MKKKLIYGVIAVVVLIGAFVLWRFWEFKQIQKAAPSSDSSSIIFFYGSTCPHCKVVEDYLAQNDVRQKVSFSEREVYANPSNAKLMLDKQNSCGVEKDYVGAVPFLWTKDKCYVGQEDIIQFFKDKMNENQQQ